MSLQSFETDDGCQIAWTRSGEVGRQSLLLSNSLGTNHRLWDAQIDTLSKHFDVIRYDTRGHGGSSVPQGGYSLDRLGRDALELLDHLEVAKASFAGVSLGGMTGQWLGYRAPERLNRLILANTSAYMGPPQGWADRIGAVRANGMEPMVEPVLDRWFTPEFRAENSPALQAVRGQLIATSPTGYAGCSAAIRDMDLRPTASLIRVPTLVIYGTRDPATPPEHGEWLHRNIPNSHSAAMPGAHLCNVELPEVFAEKMIEFLRGPHD